MSELIIKTIAEKGGRGRTSVVVSMENSTKEEIDSIALSTGRSFNEITEMLLSYAIPKCKITDDKEITVDRYKPSAKSAYKAAAVIDIKEEKPISRQPSLTSKDTAAKNVPPKSAAKPVNPVKKETTAKPQKNASPKIADTHSAVPTFKLPPITKFIDPKK